MTLARMASTIGVVLALAVTRVAVAQPVTSRPAAPSSEDSVRWAQVTYVAGRSIYVSAGRSDGLSAAALLEVVRRGAIIAVLRAAVVSSRRAACEIVGGGDSVTVAVGDSVRFVASPGAMADVASERSEPAEPSASAPALAASERWRRQLGIGGRIGIRYLVVAQRDSGGFSMSQPAADIRIDGHRIAGTPLGVSIDARGRRTRVARSDTAGETTHGRTHVYKMSMSLATASGVRVAVGRQVSEAFASVSLYDGISADLTRGRWGTGLFAGSQPSAETMGYSAEVREYGAYAQTRLRSGSASTWSMTVGAIGSYHAGNPNREFAFAQMVIGTPRLSVYAVQEVDYNRGWKSDAGEQSVQPTSTFVSAQGRPWPALTVHAGFDSRRNVRLWRDHTNPETEFDDRFRQGVWAGAGVRAGRHLRFSADVRSSDASGSLGGRATAAGGTAALERLGPSLLDIRARSTRYTSPWLEGWLHAGALSVSPLDGLLRVEIEGGLRSEHDQPGASVTSNPDGTRLRWIGTTADVPLGRSWYLLLTATREAGAWESTDQMYASLTWRF